MKIRDIFKKEVLSVTPNTTYAEVAKLLHKHKVGSVAVCDTEGKLVGIVSEKDLYRALFPEYGEYHEYPQSFVDSEKMENAIDDLRNTPIEKYMKKHVLSIRSDEPIMKAGGLMLAHHIHRLPIIDDGKLIGMISREDVFSAILKAHLGH